eukprot:8003088-Pyramimonas_sp.AAC.1
MPTGRGVLPGCVQSMPWVKIYVYDLLDFAHAQYFPVVTLAYVDDITQTQQGSWSDIVSCIVPAA